MNIHQDFEEFLRFLKEENAEYVIVGGYAVAFHGYVRATNDMDLFFRATEKNIVRIRNALKKFGLDTTADQAKEFSDPGSIIRMGIPPVRLELINNISGLSFDEVWGHRISGKYGTVSVNYLSFADLLINKKASGRPKDLADFDELGGNRK
ncbi:MAG: nucleotidyltransferase [Chitinispirillaceae bacterium]|nr:nucleotidyltransferase [Chitinispirillaceae bacterium]